jgi:hypothetical protein
MHVHTPFHPFESHPVTAPSVEVWNLVLILLGVVLVLLFRPF